ncbi:MAG: RHS repeat-associated core domain-containing protein [Bacteroidota bacterium]
MVSTGSTPGCGETVVHIASLPPSNLTYYWQTSASGTSLSYSSNYTVTYDRTVYVRARDNTTGCWSTAIPVNVTVNDGPSAPTTINTNQLCGSTRLMRSSSPPSGITWYWQGTNADGTSTENANSQYSAYSAGTYYLRARSSDGCWGESRSVNVSVNQSPAMPPVPSITYGCWETTLTKPTAPEGIEYYWQNSVLLENTDNQNDSYTVFLSETAYLKAYNTITGCWSVAREITPDVYAPPSMPSVNRIDYGLDGQRIIRNNPPSGETWYWQGTDPNGTSIDNSELYYSVTQPGTYYLRAKKNNADCWVTQSINVEAFTPDESFGSDDLSHSAQYNGNISAVKWKTFGDKREKLYAYHYDEMNRIKAAQYAQGTGGNWNTAIGHFQVYDINYDLNGNILSLSRNSTSGKIDELSYGYQGNRLQYVEDGWGEEGFSNGHNGTTSNPDYAYDENGNMTKDLNKDIVSIEYNLLNLPSKVVKVDGQYMTYIYDASGTKLSQEVYDANDQLIKSTDYIGGMIYENDELQFVQHEEGRVVNDQTTDSWEYQYNLTDHLGNVRASFTSKPKTINYNLTYEGNSDEALFENVIINNNDIFDYTDNTGNTYNKSQILTGGLNSQVGSVIAIPVGKGDKVTASVMAKYVEITQTNNPVSAIASALVTAFTGGVGSNELGSTTINNNFSTGSLIGTTGFPIENGSAPKAFLNLMFLPEDESIDLVKDATFAYDQVDVGAVQLLNQPKNQNFDELRVEDFEAAQTGYILIYLSNESNTLTEVHFDDLTIEVKEHNLIQTDDYYAFGLTHSNGYQRVSNLRNDFKYNGKEEITDLGLDWYDYGARMYMSDIGRWGVVDPLADQGNQESWSPYTYAFNNPLRFIDPDGRMATDTTGAVKPSEITTASENAVETVIDEKGTSEAWCNLGVCTALEELTGNTELQDVDANTMTGRLANSNNFEVVELSEVQELANQGDIVIGAKSETSGSGHVVLAVPGEESYSSTWKANVPQVMDTGRNKRASKQKVSLSWTGSASSGVVWYKYTGTVNGSQQTENNQIYVGPRQVLDPVVVQGQGKPISTIQRINPFQK